MNEDLVTVLIACYIWLTVLAFWLGAWAGDTSHGKSTTPGWYPPAAIFSIFGIAALLVTIIYVIAGFAESVQS